MLARRYLVPSHLSRSSVAVCRHWSGRPENCPVLRRALSSMGGVCWSLFPPGQRFWELEIHCGPLGLICIAAHAYDSQFHNTMRFAHKHTVIAISISGQPRGSRTSGPAQRRIAGRQLLRTATVLVGGTLTLLPHCAWATYLVCSSGLPLRLRSHLSLQMAQALRCA